MVESEYRRCEVEQERVRVGDSRDFCACARGSRWVDTEEGFTLGLQERLVWFGLLSASEERALGIGSASRFLPLA